MGYRDLPHSRLNFARVTALPASDHLRWIGRDGHYPEVIMLYKTTLGPSD